MPVDNSLSCGVAWPQDIEEANEYGTFIKDGVLGASL
jgi:hypothetical protein